MPVSGATAELEVDEVKDSAALADLREEWIDLHGRCRNSTPFQRPEWLIAWWNYFQQGELCVVSIRRAGRLIMLAPWFIQHNRNNGRTILFIGTPNTDYHDVLVDPDVEREALCTLAAYLGENRDRWDLCDFHELTSQSALLRMPTPAACTTHVFSGETCTWIDLPDSAEIVQALPHHISRNLRHSQHRAEREGAIEFTVADESNLPECLAALFELHRARWAAEGEPGGVLKDKELWPFHREAAAEFARSGILRFHVMKLSGKIVACIYALQERGRVYAYLSGFDPSYPKLSLGTLILGRAIEDASEQHAKEFDFLRGREDYKLLWGVKERSNCRRTITKQISP